MAASTQGRRGRERLPRDIRQPGPLRQDTVVARILFIEDRSVRKEGPASQEVDATQDRPASQVRASGTGKAKQGRGKGKKGKGLRSDVVLEITLCGGKSPADVIMFQAWEHDVRTRLRGSGDVGDTVRIAGALVQAHTDKTRFYTTSRTPMFLKAQSGTTMTRIDDKPEFLTYHPITPISSLPLLPPRSLVCLAGRVVEATEVAFVETTDGETDVPVAHLALRNGDDVIRVNFWRGTADLLKGWTKGVPILVVGVAKQYPKTGQDQSTQVELRAAPRTQLLTCPEPLAAVLTDAPSD